MKQTNKQSSSGKSEYKRTGLLRAQVPLKTADMFSVEQYAAFSSATREPHPDTGRSEVNGSFTVAHLCLIQLMFSRPREHVAMWMIIYMYLRCTDGGTSKAGFCTHTALILHRLQL